MPHAESKLLTALIVFSNNLMLVFVFAIAAVVVTFDWMFIALHVGVFIAFEIGCYS